MFSISQGSDLQCTPIYQRLLRHNTHIQCCQVTINQLLLGSTKQPQCIMQGYELARLMVFQLPQPVFQGMYILDYHLIYFRNKLNLRLRFQNFILICYYCLFLVHCQGFRRPVYLVTRVFHMHKPLRRRPLAIIIYLKSSKNSTVDLLTKIAHVRKILI